MKKKAFKKPEHLKMSKRSEEALDKTLEHWFRVRDKNEGAVPENCELCKKFQKLQTGAFQPIVLCPKCPVQIKTGKCVCVDTPYGRYTGFTPSAGEPERKRLADDEIEFLQSCYY